MRKYPGILCGLIVVVLGLLVGCSSANKQRIPKNPDPIIEGEATPEKAERALRMKVEKFINFQNENKERYKDQVMRLATGNENYNYKYYDEFPEDMSSIKITVTPTDSLSPLYRGEVQYRKVRYQTRYTRSPNRAEADTNFIRDEGVQEEHYEFDGTAWRQRSAIFDVTKSSIYSKDGWTASRGPIRRVEEDNPELFVDKVRSLFGLLD